MAKSGALMRCVGRGMCTAVVQLRSLEAVAGGTWCLQLDPGRRGLDPGWPTAKTPDGNLTQVAQGCPSLTGVRGNLNAGEEGHAVIT